MKVKKTETLTEIVAFSAGVQDASGYVTITVWPKVPQIEMCSTRGQSFVVRGDDAREFAQTLKDCVVDPVLEV